jgi:hypothetical protein
MARAVLASGRATVWERDFASNLLDVWRDREISAKQREVLQRIFVRCAR